MITPPLSISARPLLTRIVPVSCIGSMLPSGPVLVGLGSRFCGQHVRPVGSQVRPLPVRKLHADHWPLLLADDQAVGVDDLRFFVVLAVLGACGEDSVAHLVRIDHAPIIRCTLTAVSEPEHPAAKAGRFVRAVGLGIARELEKRAEAPPKAKPEPLPPPPPANTGGFVGRLVFAGLVGSVLAFLLVVLRFETLLGSTHDAKLGIRLALAALLFPQAFLLLSHWRGANQRLVQRVLNRVWGPRGAMNRREKSFARTCRDLPTPVGIIWLGAA